MKILHHLVSIFLFFYTVSSKCAFTQNCNNAAMGDCNPPDSRLFDPQNFNYTSPFQCPEFNDTVCCNNDQNTLLKNSFNLINFTFGSGANGCDLCGANLMRFWCHFTCSPNQANFVSAFDHILVPDPFTPGLNVTVLNVTFKIDPNTACEMYQSCKKTPYVTEVSAMNSAEGLLNFLGSNAVATGLEKIIMIYSNNASDTPLNITLNDCNQKFYMKDQYGYPISKNCTCNNCDTACGATADLELILHPMDVMEGFDTTLIIVFYCAVIAETLICLLGRRYFKGDRTRGKSKDLFVVNAQEK